jgi:hypothetical protein
MVSGGVKKMPSAFLDSLLNSRVKEMDNSLNGWAFLDVIFKVVALRVLVLLASFVYPGWIQFYLRKLNRFLF